jgi:hypothetical protein
MNRKVLIIVFAIISLTGFSQKKEIHVVLLAGQSNMQGHGNYDTLEESVKKRLKKVSKRVFLSTSDNKNIEPRPLAFYEAKKSEKYPFTKHFGPELFIGLTLAEANPNQEFLIIKKAVGGTSLYGAWNPNWSKDKADIAERGAERKAMKLYSAFQNKIEMDLERLKSQGKSYKIIGMAWMQGESDTNKVITATNYQKNLENLIKGYRNLVGYEKMPFVIGQINALPRKYKAGPSQVREAMQNIADSDRKIGIVNTKAGKNWIDFPKHSDNLHYNTEGQRNLGTKFGEILLELQVALKR